MSPTKTSKARFDGFREKYRKGEFRHEPDDPQVGDNKKPRKLSAEQKQKRRNYLKLYIRRLWPHWKLVTFLTLLALIVSVLELVQPLFARHIIDKILLIDASVGEKIWKLNVVGAIYLVVVVFDRVLGICRSWYQRLLNERVILTLRRVLFDRMLRLPLNVLSDMKIGGILSRLTDDINKTTGLLQMAVISPGVSLVRLLMSVVILFTMNWKLALTALGIIPPIMLLSMIAIRRIRPVYRAIQKDVSLVDGRVGEAFQGIRAVRAFRGELREDREYTVGVHAITRMRMFAASREIVVWSAWGFLMALVAVAIMWAGGYWCIKGQATIGDILAFQFYTMMLLNPVWQIVESMTELQRSLAAMERVFSVLEMPVDKPDRPNAKLAPSVVDEIRFEGVWFAYEKDDNGQADLAATHLAAPSLVEDEAQAKSKDVIRNFDLTVPGGHIVALVGRSGAGKTTITDLVARFYDPVRGRITLNGTDLRDYELDSYRELIGVVQQEVFLFDGSVRENIAYALRDATDEQVTQAAIQANAHEFIVDLPNGYDSIIGERGVKLSGGQRQRLSIARALLANPQILILDEATSNLDTESEQLIQQSMTELLRDRTTFVIAHRLSTITHADQIVVMENGEIEETGTHEQLMHRNGMYSDMIRRQLDAVSLI